MTVSLGDELVVALAVQAEGIADKPPEASGFSLPDLMRLTGRSMKAVEESLYDLHRAGVLVVKVEVRAGVVRITSAELTPGGKTLAARRFSVVQKTWGDRASDSGTEASARG